MLPVLPHLKETPKPRQPQQFLASETGILF